MVAMCPPACMPNITWNTAGPDCVKFNLQLINETASAEVYFVFGQKLHVRPRFPPSRRPSGNWRLCDVRRQLLQGQY